MVHMAGTHNARYSTIMCSCAWLAQENLEGGHAVDELFRHVLSALKPDRFTRDLPSLPAQLMASFATEQQSAGQNANGQSQRLSTNLTAVVNGRAAGDLHLNAPTQQVRDCIL